MNPKGRTTIEVGGDGVAVITIINPPVNSLSFDGKLIKVYFFLFFELGFWISSNRV